MASPTVASHFPAHKDSESVAEISDHDLTAYELPDPCPKPITVWPRRSGTHRLLMTIFLALLVAVLAGFAVTSPQSSTTAFGRHHG